MKNEIRKPVAMCYDHLSGILGEALHNHFLEREWLLYDADIDEYAFTETGEEEFNNLGIALTALKQSKRKPVCRCIERHGGAEYPHIGAHLGTLIAEQWLKQGFIENTGGKEYALTLKGEKALARLNVIVPEV